MIMGGFTLFLSIVVLVFGILQIILFFKIWGMTTNVKSLLKEVQILSGTTKKRLLDEKKELENYEQQSYWIKERLEMINTEITKIDEAKELK